MSTTCILQVISTLVNQRLYKHDHDICPYKIHDMLNVGDSLIQEKACLHMEITYTLMD